MESSEEVGLACAVLEMALQDVRSRGQHDYRSEAELFCLNETGGWARRRRFWCDIAGIDEASFVAAARRRANNTTVVA